MLWWVLHELRWAIEDDDDLALLDLIEKEREELVWHVVEHRYGHVCDVRLVFIVGLFI
jgi:hypothetical protein